MKKTIIIFVLVLLTACTNDDFTITYDPAAHNFMPYDKPFYTDNSDQPYLTREQAIEDYLYMWQTLEENAPYVADLPNYPRWANNTPEQIKERYWEELKNGPRNMNLDSYMSFMSKSLSELGSVGHIFVIDSDLYKQFQDLYKLVQEGYYGYDWEYDPYGYHGRFIRMDEFVNNPKTFEFYKHLNKGVASLDNKSGSTFDPNRLFSNNVELTKQDHIPYVQIRSFGAPTANAFEYIEYAAVRFYEFFEENKDAENIIIDIRGNGGGSTTIWSEGIVKPLFFGDTLTYYSLLGLQNGGLNIYLWGGEHPVNLPNDWRDYFPNVGDISRFDMITLIENVVSSDYAIGFNGKVWLLVDGLSYSASDGLASFSKQTGFATVIGTQTGGAGGGGWNPYTFPLPNSGMLIYYEPWYSFNEDGTCNQIVGTKPDIDVGDRDALDVVRELIAAG